MKVSYMAYQNRETIFERFFKAILKSYYQLNEQGIIKNPYPLKSEQKAIMKIIAGDSSIGSIVKAH
jgi:hypothetical protein